MQEEIKPLSESEILDVFQQLGEKKNNNTKQSEKEGVDAQNALLKSMMELANSDDPADVKLMEEITEKFSMKMEKFAENLKSLPRAQRRKFKGFNSFSNQFKASIGL